MIEVGDYVEYCFEGYGNERYHGSIGRVLEVRNYYGYSEYQCAVFWESGLLSEHESYKTPRLFWDRTIKKACVNRDYDPTQMGDTEDDI